MLEAPVTAVYHGGNKTLAMQIDGSGRDGVQIWHLGPQSNLAPEAVKDWPFRSVTTVALAAGCGWTLKADPMPG